MIDVNAINEDLGWLGKVPSFRGRRTKDNGMDTVKVKRTELLETVKANRATHRNTFEKACVGYRAECVKRLDAMLADARAGKRINQHVGLIEPTDQTKDYDRAIKMLEMSVENVIELSQGEFAQYVMDDWRWKEQFETSTAMYLR